MPLFFHNGKHYDYHIVLKHLTPEFIDTSNVSVIPSNSEQYISIQIGNIRILDSFQFLSSSLDSLVNTLRKDGARKFQHINQHFTEDEREFVLRKGVYCYEHMDGPTKFKEPSLPPRESFYSKLSEEECSETDYLHAQNVWSKFHMKSLQDYHDLYLTTDVLLLADVFETFRDLSMRYYGLDPAHYFTSPGLSWDACLKMTKVRLELLTDIDMLLMFERSLRGGVSTITGRYAKANNPLIGEEYDPTKDHSYLFYIDCNNLYGHSMSSYLPTGDFKDVPKQMFDNFDVLSIPDDADTGFLLDVDLRYPSTLHDKHNDLPLAPEHLIVESNQLSEHQQRLQEETQSNTNSKVKKLVPNFYEKERYVLHYRNLKYYLQQGMECVNIHRIISFTQSP